jgi:hypothetical protein
MRSILLLPLMPLDGTLRLMLLDGTLRLMLLDGMLRLTVETQQLSLLLEAKLPLKTVMQLKKMLVASVARRMRRTTTL